MRKGRRTAPRAAAGGAGLALLLAVSLVSAPALTDAEAQGIDLYVSSTALDGTSVIEFENRSGKSMGRAVIWLPSDVALESFKGEDGWTGTENVRGIVVFTADSPTGHDGTVKFGLKTDQAKPRINWEVFDTDGGKIGTGVSKPADMWPVLPTKVEEPAEEDPVAEEPAEDPNTIHGFSSFRLVPDKPSVGDSIRVVGMSFTPDRQLDLHIGDAKAATFNTDAQGNFLITSKVPADTEPARIDFAVTDDAGNRKAVTVRVNAAEVRVAPPAPATAVPLTINGLPETVHRGDILRISGTATPEGTVTAEITGPDGSAVTAEPRSVDAEGVWSFETMVSHDSAYGRYEAVITDGASTINRSWNVESSKTIEIVPTTLKFEPGDLMVFNGTAVPGEPIEFVLENPLGVEVFTDVVGVDGSGHARFTYQTETSSPEGTYVLLAKQKDSTEIILTGLGELPKEHIVAKMDKVNYKKSEVATIRIDGPASATISMLIIDPSDKRKFSDNQIRLQPDGKLEYSLDLKDYASGVYTLVLSRANTKTTEVFSVGLKTGSGDISLTTTKTTYRSNDPILVLGETNGNVLITVGLIDPDGNIVKEKNTFTNKDGRISEGSFRIPSDAKSGIWKIKASSGSNFETTDLEVVAAVREGIHVTIDGTENIPAVGKVVNFHVLGAKNTVKIEITDSEGVTVGDTVTFPATPGGEVKQPWPIPKDLSPGTYTITASDAHSRHSADFVLE